MGKKNKNKFKKQIKAQALQEMTQTPAAPAATSKKDFVIKNVAIIQPDTAKEFNLSQIKYDLKKTLIVILVLALLIGGLYFVDLKYGLLLHFGTWLFKVLNIHN